MGITPLQGLLIAALLGLLCLVVYRASKKGKTCKTFECPATHTKKSNAANIKKHTRADCCDAIATPTCATFSCPATTHTKKSNAANIKKHTLADCCDAIGTATCATFSCPATTHRLKTDAANINKNTLADCCDVIGTSTDDCPDNHFKLVSGTTYSCEAFNTPCDDSSDPDFAYHYQVSGCERKDPLECKDGSKRLTADNTCITPGTTCSAHAENAAQWTLDATSGLLTCNAQCKPYASPDDGGACQVRACGGNLGEMSEDGVCRQDGASCVSGVDPNRDYTWTSNGSDLLVCTPGDCKAGYGQDASQQCQEEQGVCDYTGTGQITNGIYRWQANAGVYECMFAFGCDSEYVYKEATQTCEQEMPESCKSDTGYISLNSYGTYNCFGKFSHDAALCNACPYCQYCNHPDFDGWACYDKQKQAPGCTG